VNPAFTAVTGFSREEVQGTTPRILKSGVHDDAFYRELWATISAGGIWEGRFVNRKKDGSQYTEEATISPVRDTTGTIASYVAVKRDITHSLELEAQLLQSQKLESIGRLAGGVAHDFNNLLSVIMGYTEFAMRRVAAGDPVWQDLEEVRRAGARAAALTRQLLVFSRQQELRLVPLSLNQVVSGVEKMLRRIVGEDIHFVQVLASDLGVARAAPGQIELVLMNLVVNARDAMPAGGELHIETANAVIDAGSPLVGQGIAPGDYVKLFVADTGIGMDAQTRGRIFEPFFTTKGIGKGTGLGLLMAHGIIKQSGGGITVESEPGRGTLFELYLPRDADARVTPSPQTLPFPRETRGNETILVVEDDEALRSAAKRSLAEEGYTVLEAEDGQDALAVAKRHQGAIHLLLADLIMPRMGGRALAVELLRARSQLKVLYVSGYCDEVDLSPDLPAQGAHLLAKPFAGSELTRKVREVLDGRGGGSATAAPGAEGAVSDQGEPLLEGLPAAAVDRLREAVQSARYDEMVEVVESIRATHAQTAAKLAGMIERFEYDGLWRLMTGEERRRS
jgi:two-component system, cell cycle sensor histidine kinase and response regulator CckA